MQNYRVKADSTSKLDFVIKAEDEDHVRQAMDELTLNDLRHHAIDDEMDIWHISETTDAADMDTEEKDEG